MNNGCSDGKKIECGHLESSRRIDWEGFADLGVGDWYIPYYCAECGLRLADPADPPTFGQHLLTALIGLIVITGLAFSGIVPYLLTGIWVMLALGFVFVSIRMLAATVRVGGGFVKEARRYLIRSER